MATRWVDIPDPFLGSGSVNTFPLPGSRFLIMQQLDFNNGRAVSYVVRAEWLQTRDKVRPSQLRVSSVQESVKEGLERVKLKNLHC
jgi:hypothetical protein